LSVILKCISCIVISVTSHLSLSLLSLWNLKIYHQIKYITWFFWLICEFTEKNSMSGCVLSRSQSISQKSQNHKRHPCQSQVLINIHNKKKILVPRTLKYWFQALPLVTSFRLSNPWAWFSFSLFMHSDYLHGYTKLTIKHWQTTKGK
jgi:hypothetical protein